MDRDNRDYRHQKLYQTIKEYNSSLAQTLDFDQREFCAWTLLLDETSEPMGRKETQRAHPTNV
jgi:hypothetical protein